MAQRAEPLEPLGDNDQADTRARKLGPGTGLKVRWAGGDRRRQRGEKLTNNLPVSQGSRVPVPSRPGEKMFPKKDVERE